jgi:hypothetical protein
VVIEATPAAEAADPVYHASLAVERRADPTRRLGHLPPVIAEADGDDPKQLLETLYPIAADNVSVAQHILRWQARNRGEPGGREAEQRG